MNFKKPAGIYNLGKSFNFKPRPNIQCTFFLISIEDFQGFFAKINDFQALLRMQDNFVLHQRSKSKLVGLSYAMALGSNQMNYIFTLVELN